MRAARAAGALAGLVLAGLALAGTPALAHRFNVFAWADCEAIEVVAALEDGRAPAAGEVRLYDGAGALLLRLDLGGTGSLRVPLGGLDLGSGARVEVRAGDHRDDWTLLPEDMAGACTS